ncbi:unknown protein [Seminavis robusta]|uniref:Uncharacterized protein n=1 Tax=Seminavis robusta TaxID=568900 RepID=A0A9N8F486_9STRA|nr:unknown protein [Seminavis robusta]|eukprot:Sro3980_g352290.1 n/a (277) ;mRNA; f:713-1655
MEILEKGQCGKTTKKAEGRKKESKKDSHKDKSKKAPKKKVEVENVEENEADDRKSTDEELSDSEDESSQESSHKNRKKRKKKESRKKKKEKEKNVNRGRKGNRKGTRKPRSRSPSDSSSSSSESSMSMNVSTSSGSESSGSTNRSRVSRSLSPPPRQWYALLFAHRNRQGVFDSRHRAEKYATKYSIIKKFCTKNEAKEWIEWMTKKSKGDGNLDGADQEAEIRSKTVARPPMQLNGRDKSAKKKDEVFGVNLDVDGAELKRKLSPPGIPCLRSPR